MNAFDIDAYSPAQMAARVEKAGITKGNMDALSTLVLAMLAGAFISFGAVFCTFVIHDSTLPGGLTRLPGGWYSVSALFWLLSRELSCSPATLPVHWWPLL